MVNSFWTFAQFEPAPVSKSQIKETLNGKTYYLHTVTQGHTLFSIARAYEVTPREIADANPQYPDLIQVVRIGQVIRIPSAGAVKVEAPVQQASPVSGVQPPSQTRQFYSFPVETTEFIEHEVARRETLFGISRRYDVTQEEVLHHNPEARSGLRYRQILRIPVKKTSEVEYFYYLVAPGETRYGLSNRFGITTEELSELNPDIEQLGLQAGQRIRIPAKVARDMAPGEIPPESFVFVPAEPLPDDEDTDIYCLNPQLKSHYNVALLIPLFLDQFSAASTVIPADHVSFTFLPYYQGILVALDSIRQKGVNITLHVFDVARDLASLRELTQRPGFDRLDLIIGPFYRETLGYVAGFGLRHSIPVVSPLLDDPTQLKRFPNLFQVSPSLEVQINALAGYIARTYPSQNIILVHNDQPQAKDLITGFKESIMEEMALVRQFGDSLNMAKINGYFINGALIGSHRSNVLVTSDSLFLQQNQTRPGPGQSGPEIKEIVFRTSGIGGLVNAFDREKENVLVTLIDGEAFLSNYLRELNLLSTQFNITIFGIPRWADYQTIDPRYFETLKVHIFSPDFVEYRDQHIRNFVYRYREVFKTEPSDYAFKGVQTGYFFFNALGTFGKEFPRCMNKLNGLGIESPFVFERLQNQDDGWENLKFILYRHREFRRENVFRPVLGN